jgi:hypothetical protein
LRRCRSLSLDRDHAGEIMSHLATQLTLDRLKQIGIIKACCFVANAPPAVISLHRAMTALDAIDMASFVGAIREPISPNYGQSADSFHVLALKVAQAVYRNLWIASLLAIEGPPEAKADALLDTLADGVLGQCLAVAPAAVLAQKPGQRTARTQSEAQSVIEHSNGLPRSGPRGTKSR